jgi:hypothetical protein
MQHVKEGPLRWDLMRSVFYTEIFLIINRQQNGNHSRFVFAQIRSNFAPQAVFAPRPSKYAAIIRIATKKAYHSKPLVRNRGAFGLEK